MCQTCRWQVEVQVRSSSRCPRFSQGPRYADTCCRVSSALKCCWKCWVRWHGRGWVCSSRPQSPQPPSQIWSQTTLYNLLRSSMSRRSMSMIPIFRLNWKEFLNSPIKIKEIKPKLKEFCTISVWWAWPAQNRWKSLCYNLMRWLIPKLSFLFLFYGCLSE